MTNSAERLRSASPEISPAQCRAARGLIGWPPGRVEQEAHLPAGSVERYETGVSAPDPAFMGRLRGCLEAAGVDFLEETGVQLRHPLADSEGLRPDQLNAANDK